eukprot:4719776-Amphidinium_carterae.1
MLGLYLSLASCLTPKEDPSWLLELREIGAALSEWVPEFELPITERARCWTPPGGNHNRVHWPLPVPEEETSVDI